MPLNETFPTYSFTNEAIIRFGDRQLLIRYRIRFGPTNEGSAAPLIQLEAVWVMKADWDGVPTAKKMVLATSAWTAIFQHLHHGESC